MDINIGQTRGLELVQQNGGTKPSSDSKTDDAVYSFGKVQKNESTGFSREVNSAETKYIIAHNEYIEACNEKIRLHNDIKSLSKEIDGLHSKADNLKNILNSVEGAITNVKNQLDIAKTDETINTLGLEEDLSELQESYDVQHKQLNEILTEITTKKASLNELQEQKTRADEVCDEKETVYRKAEKEYNDLDTL